MAFVLRAAADPRACPSLAAALRQSRSESTVVVRVDDPELATYLDAREFPGRPHRPLSMPASFPVARLGTEAEEVATALEACAGTQPGVPATVRPRQYNDEAAEADAVRRTCRLG